MLSDIYFKTRLMLIQIVILLITFTSVSFAQTTEESNNQRLELRQQVIDFTNKNLEAMVRGYVMSLPQKSDIYSDPASLSRYQYAWHLFYNLKSVQTLPFKFISEDEFKVVNVEPDRLAINDGTQILWNAKRLAEISDFSVFDAAQIILHEYGHQISEVNESLHPRAADPKTPVNLETKDKVAAELSLYLKNHTIKVNNPKNNEALYLLSLDVPKKLNEIFLYNYEMSQYREYMFKDFMKYRLVTWIEQADSVTGNEKQHKLISFDTESNVFSKSIEASYGQYQDKNLIAFPHVEIVNASLSSAGEYVINAQYTPRFLDRSMKESNLAKLAPYRRTISLDERAFDFRQPLPEADFKVEKIITQGKQRFVTLNISNMPEHILKLGAKNVSLLAREASTGKRFSFPLRKIYLENGLLKAMVTIDNSWDLQLTELMTTESMKQSNEKLIEFTEYSIRPKSLQKVAGSVRSKEEITNRSSYKLEHFGAWFGVSDKNLELSLPRVLQAENVKGLVIELRAVLSGALKNNQGSPYDPTLHTAVGEKIYVPMSKLTKYLKPNGFRGALEFTLPIDRPVINQLESEGFLFNDLHTRGITNLWVHLNDGEMVRLVLENEPVARIHNPSEIQMKQMQKERNREIYLKNKCSSLFN
jgi:hypothetical protein